MHKTDGICKLCQKIERQRTHIFMKCDLIQKLYEYFSPFLLRLDPTVKEKAFGIFEQVNKKKLLRNYITYTIRHTIYRNRNMTVSRNDYILIILIKKVKYWIRKDLKERFNIAKMKHILHDFQNNYLIEDILGTLEDNKLKMNI